MLHGPGHSTEECKVLKEYSAKYAVQQPHNEKEACSVGNRKRGKTVKIYGATEEVNNMAAHDAPTGRKKNGKTRQKILIVTRIMKFHQRSNAFMGLTD